MHEITVPHPGIAQAGMRHIVIVFFVGFLFNRNYYPAMTVPQQYRRYEGQAKIPVHGRQTGHFSGAIESYLTLPVILVNI
jgi:hypothetical protein